MTSVAPSVASASGTTAKRILRKIFSFPVAIASLLCVLGVLTVRSRFDDPDMWWHLKTGEVIWSSHHVPTADIFSFTARGQASIPHEWLSQLLIYTTYRIAGYSGMMFWLCLLTAALLAGGYGLCVLVSGNAKVSFLGALTIWLFGTIGFAIRPQMVGYLLLIVELAVLQLGRTRSPRWFLTLPPLFAVWVNCHGSFSLGIGMAAVFLFSSYCSFEAGSLVAIPWEPRARTMLAWSLGASVFALLLNPVGVKLVLYPFEAMFHLSANVSAVSEWQPLQFTDVRAFGLLVVICGILLAVMVRRSELYLHELLVLALATWMAASHRRLLFVFGILTAPILARVLANSWENYEPDKDKPLPNVVLIALALLVAIWAFPSRQNLTAQVAQGSPVAAVEYLKANHMPGPMLNDWPDGGYLIWAAPEYPDFIDGRGDVFDWRGVTEEYGRWAMLEDPPNALLDKYHVNFCLLARSSTMASVMARLPGWKTVYADGQYVIFAREE